MMGWGGDFSGWLLVALGIGVVLLIGAAMFALPTTSDRVAEHEQRIDCLERGEVCP